MGFKYFLLICAIVLCYYLAAVATQETRVTKLPQTRFTCQGRASGYYADVDTGCQVYHMCDGLGRQFSYTCPNTTLFQQRMLICDHWYMVNCSMSERDYDANLLIGQRDKPFVSDEEMRQRTPRPDILSVPPNSNYYDGLREAESKFPIHPGNSIVGIADAISNTNNNGLDSAKQNYRPPSSWSTGTGKKPHRNSFNDDEDVNNQENLASAASQGPRPTFQPTPENKAFIKDTTVMNVTPLSQELIPPKLPITTTTEPSFEDSNSEAKTGSTESSEDPVYKFIKRFDPNSPDSHKTAMSKSEIIDLNAHLPPGQASSEEDRSPKKHKNVGNNFNIVLNEGKGVTESSRYDTVNIKPKTPTESSLTMNSDSKVPIPDRELLPPKTEYTDQPSTTMGPPIYYEWKWAVPAFDLLPPKEGNATNSTAPQVKVIPIKRPFSEVRKPVTREIEPTPSSVNTEYNISSYFVPDYIFPLDKHHPSYDNEDARTSFQVDVARPGRSSYGENSACPHCHPAYLKPGTCEPCIVKR